MGERHPEQLGCAPYKLRLGQGVFKPRLFIAPEEVLGSPGGGVIKDLWIGLLCVGKLLIGPTNAIQPAM